MTTPPDTPPLSRAEDSPADYLVVDEFLVDLIGTRALKSALELGVIDELANGPGTAADLAAARGGDPTGMRLLSGLLAASGVVEISGERIALAPRFVRALKYRGLLDAKMDFIGFVLLDFVDRFNSLIVDPDAFMREAQVFRLFDYRRAAAPSEQNYAWTQVWMRLTTALTRHEAGACLAHYDFGQHSRVLDIGGNSGEFVIRLCRAHPELRATVMDLQVVCQFGQDHVLGEPERDRIAFFPGSALDTPIPEGHDLIVFKSMLHDWQEPEVRRFLERAVEALPSGGTLLIFERAPLDFAEGTPPLSLLPILMFARFYRAANVYTAMLEQLGISEIEVRDLRLDSGFFLLTARK